jgi:hypothetical protein
MNNIQLQDDLVGITEYNNLVVFVLSSFFHLFLTYFTMDM